MREDMILGVDLGWISQLESIGYQWVDINKKNIDPIQAAKEMGANTVSTSESKLPKKSPTV